MFVSFSLQSFHETRPLFLSWQKLKQKLFHYLILEVDKCNVWEMTQLKQTIWIPEFPSTPFHRSWTCVPTLHPAWSPHSSDQCSLDRSLEDRLSSLHSPRLPHRVRSRSETSSGPLVNYISQYPMEIHIKKLWGGYPVEFGNPGSNCI